MSEQAWIFAVLISLIMGASAIITASTLKGKTMVYPELVPILDEIRASIAGIPGAIASQAANAEAAANAAAEQDKADSLAEVQAVADQLKSAVGA